MGTVCLIISLSSLAGTLLTGNSLGTRTGGSYPAGVIFLVMLTFALPGSGRGEPKNPESFDERDTRVFKAVACTKDKKPMEALYYIAASRVDLSAGKPSPSAQLMKEQVEHNWQTILSQLTMEQVLEERFSDTYHRLLNEMIPRLQQAVEEKSGVSVAVSEVNSRSMDQAKDQDVPICSR